MVHWSADRTRAPHGNGTRLSLFARYWDFDGNKMWFDADQPIRFRVQSVKLHPVPTRADMQVHHEISLPSPELVLDRRTKV